MSQNPQILSTALVHPDEVFSAAMGSMSDAVMGEPDGEVVGFCNAASQRIEGYLGRKVYVRLHTLIYQPHEWKRSEHPSFAVETYLKEWPLVEMETVGTFDTSADEPGAQLVYSNAVETKLQAFTGYMREADRGDNDAETLTNLNAKSHLSDLTVVPPVLPYDIRDAAITIVLIKLARRRAGREDFSRKTIQVGAGSITVESSDPQAESRVLETLSRYRK